PQPRRKRRLRLSGRCGADQRAGPDALAAGGLHLLTSRRRGAAWCRYFGGTTPPSSLVNGVASGGRIASTASDGRASRTPRLVRTKGRLIRIGSASIASSSASSDRAGSSRPSSVYFAS